jgi:hypothetical protein
MGKSLRHISDLHC